jgi:hypothetical protein
MSYPSHGQSVLFPQHGALARTNEQHEILLYPDHETIKGFASAGWASSDSISGRVESASIQFVAASIGESSLTFYLKELDLENPSGSLAGLWSGECHAEVKTSVWQHIECNFSTTVEGGKPLSRGRRIALVLLVYAKGSPCVMSTSARIKPTLPKTHAEILRNGGPLLLTTLSGRAIEGAPITPESFLTIRMGPISEPSPSSDR